MIRSPELRQALAVVASHKKAKARESKSERLARAKVLLAAKEASLRQPRERDSGYLAYLRRQPCRIGRGCHGPVQAAHLRYSDAAHGRRNPGLQCKPADRWATSLCATHHAEQHSAGDERRWWNSYGLDGSEVAISQYAAFKGDPQ